MKKKSTSVIKRLILIFTVMIQIVFYPAATFADDTSVSDPGSVDPAASSQTTDSTPSSSPTAASDPAPDASQTAPTQPTAPTTTGPVAPTGAGSQTYTYNPNTGLWENDYYTWDPVTHQTAPKTPQNYSYNPATGMWDTTEYRYDAPSGHYVPNTVSTTKPPKTVAANAGPNDPLIANTGPNSSNNIGVNNNSNGTFNLFFDTRISNTMNSSAISGNASVLQNTTGGSALTGDANDVVNLLNLLQSSWDPTMTFTANVNGNQTGDLLLDPNQILNTGSSSQNGINANDNRNLDINVQNNGQIVNNVNLGAKSGDAAVSQNTTGGDAKSGDANVLANIINLINSGITSGNSFLGVININGNLNGDILIPENLVAQLDTTGPNSTNTVNQNGNTTLNATTVDNRSIDNNVNLSAASGDANSSGNTTAGDATTGTATTKVNIYNLTGRDIIGDNALLVFVNIQGKWTGLIFNAPAGSTTILGTGPNSTNTVNGNSNKNFNIDTNSNSQIVNNVTGNATSGDATVSDNTHGGSAKTGNATASANILNLINSKLSLDGWFGVLFINVLGSWNGSFGVNTAAGNIPASAVMANPDGSPAVFKLATGPNNNYVAVPAASVQTQNSSQQVIGATSDNTKPPTSPQPAVHPQQHFNWLVPSIGMSVGALLLLAEEVVSARQRRSTIA